MGNVAVSIVEYRYLNEDLRDLLLFVVDSFDKRERRTV